MDTYVSYLNLLSTIEPSSEKEVLIKPPLMDGKEFFEKVKFPKMLELVKSAKKEILINSGEFSSRYYDHPLMMEAVEEKLRSDVKITITAGPSLSVDKEVEESLNKFKEKYLNNKLENILGEKNLVDKMYQDFNDIRKVFKLLFEGEETTGKRLKFYFNKERERYHYTMIDSRDLIFFGHHGFQSETEEVNVYRDSTLVCKTLRNDFMSRLATKERIDSFDTFFKYYDPEWIDTKANFESRKDYIIGLIDSSEALWKTVPNLVKESGVREDVVEKILNDNDDYVIKSDRTTSKGDAFYSTRDHFIAKASAKERFLGALQNQLCW